MRAVPLTQLAMGINRLRVKGGASPNGLYDLVNAYVTAAGTVVPREGTIRAETLDSTTVGLMALGGKFHVFSDAIRAVPAGYVCDVLAHAQAPYTPPFPGEGAYFTPGAGGYTVESVLNFDDGDGSSAFTDTGAAGAVWTSHGGAIESVAQAKFGTGSLSCDGNTKYITVPVAAGSALDLVTNQPDWTVEFWYWPTTIATGGIYLLCDLTCSTSSTTGSTLFRVYIAGSTLTVQNFGSTGGWSSGGPTGPCSVVAQSWNHIAICRDGNMVRLYCNGSFVATANPFTSIPAFPANGSYQFGSGAFNNFGASQVMYIDGIRITKGACLYGGDFTPPTSAPSTSNVTFPYNVASLLHFDDGNNSTAFADEVLGMSWAANGAAKETNTVYKLGTGSGVFLANTDNIEHLITAQGGSDLAYHNPDFTVEAFIYPLDVTSAATHTWMQMSHRVSSGLDDTLFNVASQGSTLTLFYRGTSANNVIVANALPTVAQWYHVAVVRIGATLSIYVNGVLGGTTAIAASQPLVATNDPWYLGAEGSSGTQTADGYIDEFRVLKGIAVYRADFTPPGAPYTAPGVANVPPSKIWFAQPFMGFPYVVAEFTNGDIFHFWLQYSGTWAPNTVYTNSSIVLPTQYEGLAFQAERNTPVNPTWAPETAVALNSIVEPTEYTGYMYKAIAIAGANPHTGSVEPTWPTVSNGTVQEFGDFSVSSTSSVTSGGSASATPLATTITDRYGDSADVAGQSGTAASSTEVIPTASTTIGQWAAGTLFAPGAVVKPSTGQGAFINAIPNGDFEAGADGNWTLGTGWSILNDGHAYQGNWYAAFSHTGAGFFDTVMTTGAAVTAGQSVTVNGYAQGDSDGQICLILNWYDATNTLISTTKGALGNGGGGAANPPNYGPVSVTGVAPANAKTVKAGFEYQTGSGAARAGRVDLLSWNLETPAAVSSFLYEAVQANPATSGSSEPAWPTTEGNEVVDGGVTWKAIGTSIITWQALPIMESGAVEPTWPTVVGGSVYDGNMSWTAISRQITDKNCPNTKQVCLGASHVFAGDKDIVAYCAAVNPTDWTSANNAGYLPTGLNNYGANPVACLGLYRSNLIVLNSGGYQMWQIDPDPANMALLDAEPVGSIYTRGAQSAGNDMLFTTEVGIRNIGVAGATANLQVGSTGQPVDPIVLPLLKAATYDPISLYYPGRGQFWDIWGSLALVMTMNGAGQKTWSRYVFPDVITDWTLNAGVLYLRSAGNLVWQLDANTLVDDAGGANTPFQGIIQWPYLDAGALGINKMLVGVDIVGDGQVTIQIGFNQADKTSFDDNAGFATSTSVTPAYTITAADTVPGEPIPIPVTAPSYSLILTFAGNQAWTLEAANLYMAPVGGAGATG